MKLLVILCIIGVAVAAPPPKYRSGQEPEIIRYENDNNGLGNYRFAYEQTDGTKREEQGELKNEGREDESIVVRGSYSWVGPDGVQYTVIYIADDNGFQPEIQQGPGPPAPAPPAPAPPPPSPDVPPGVVASLLG